MARKKAKNIVAERTAYYRKKKKKSQEQAEDESGINFSRVESGKHEIQTMTLDNLSEYLDVSQAQLLENKEKKDNP